MEQYSSWVRRPVTRYKTGMKIGVENESKKLLINVEGLQINPVPQLHPRNDYGAYLQDRLLPKRANICDEFVKRAFSFEDIFERLVHSELCRALHAA